ncbi:MAG TPA: transposase, partial [Clostridia bacterium]|nr:transposase [Clostridia bacterium]
MPYGLERYHETNQSYFVTFSCYKRQRRLADARPCDVFIDSLERMRRNHRFPVYGFTLMPEHVHLLISEPEIGTLAQAIQALKISVARKLAPFRSGPERLSGRTVYYDHNVRSHQSFVQKLRYIHRNSVKRGLCANPEDWPWSSFRHYATAEIGPVEI